MKMGIVIYSQTENTHLTALKLKEKLIEKGHEVELEMVETVGENPPRAKNVDLESIPDITGYDGLIFGSPVHAFTLAPAMTSYLDQIPILENKRIALFVTKSLPFNWTGGNQAIGKMKKICQSKGGKIVGNDIVVWRGDVDKKIENMIRQFSVLF
ncbi:MAG: flavodoxin [Euryarchaeota archaeon]|nr:flavodoxin [Euryarchaeota archaeon]MBV1755425.1 flavodoxin [Methanobacterium sp.]MBV1768471.1 flavodoxin [Methanobacterium sp.]